MVIEKLALKVGRGLEMCFEVVPCEYRPGVHNTLLPKQAPFSRHRNCSRAAGKKVTATQPDGSQMLYQMRVEVLSGAGSLVLGPSLMVGLGRSVLEEQVALQAIGQNRPHTYCRARPM